MAAALLLLLAAAVAGARVGDLARRDTGDIFTISGTECNAAQCAEHGAGSSATLEAGTEGCACACPQRAPLFREDRELCVDDLPECSLATFGTGAGRQRIPFVFLPLKGQIIHPSKEITFQNVKTPICAVSGAQFLTRKGFLDLRNTLDSDVPFSLFRDEGRTFLQWSGEDEVRIRMSGRVMVVRLLCRDVDTPLTSPLDLRGVFTPCVAFRVQGTPPRHISNVTEVQFAPNAQTSGSSNTSGLSVAEYVAIGISSLLLGLIYVASVLLYLHIRKRRKAASEESTTRRLKGLKNKDGTTITERDIVRINNERQTLPNSMGHDDGVVKKNPLLNMNRTYHDTKSNFTSDSGSNVSDSDEFANNSARSDDNLFNNQTTSAIIHTEIKLQHENEINHREDGIERLPDEHVSIVETTDDRDIARPVGTTRRKLYFNPAYFEPQLMAEPPAAALEFLTKIREVISIAKHKMASKRFHPVLNEIPEEETYPSTGNSTDLYQGLGSQRSGSVVSLKRENSRKKSCVGCPGCKSDSSNDIHNFMKYDVPACSNCIKNKGDKQSSIRKWLENIPTGKQQLFYNEFIANENQNNIANSLLSLPTENRRKIRKQNSFSDADSLHLVDNFMKCKRSSTMSVRSEPPLRSCNLPLPEFRNVENTVDYHKYYFEDGADGRSKINDYRSRSLRNKISSQRRNTVNNKNLLPDMVNEAMALDNFSTNYNHSSSDDERFHNKKNPVISNSYVRNNSESPPGNDYETDSLERSSNKKGATTPTEYTDVPSSQASPSLSNALPLEEELTMRNAVYKTHSSSNSNTPSPQREISIEQNHYETIGTFKSSTQNVPKVEKFATPGNDYSLVTEVYVNNNYDFGSAPTSPSGSECSMGSRKLNYANNIETEEMPGRLTIEVKDPPENYIKIHESDGFEPDTLDRKHQKQKEVVENCQFSRKEFIKTIDNNGCTPNQRIRLRSSGTFIKNNDKVEYAAKFNSLRNENDQRKNAYEKLKLSPTLFSGSKSLDDGTDETWDESCEWHTKDGRILTLELRHSKRQRQCTPPTIKQLKNLQRPDILPPLPPTDDSPIYEQPTFPPRRVEIETIVDPQSKNEDDRSLSPRKFMKNISAESVPCKNPHSNNLNYGPSCSPLSASVQSQSSGYENISKMSNRPNELFKNNPIVRTCSANAINTNTFVRGQREDGHIKRFRKKKGSNIEDSGYLSSDSTSSRQVQRKIVIAKILSGSESDDTENEARSESGAESIETHSVYFGSFRKLETNDNYNNNKGVRDSKKLKYTKNGL